MILPITALLWSATSATAKNENYYTIYIKYIALYTVVVMDKLTVKELRAKATELKIPGRSKLKTKNQLVAAIEKYSLGKGAGGKAKKSSPAKAKPSKGSKKRIQKKKTVENDSLPNPDNVRGEIYIVGREGRDDKYYFSKIVNVHKGKWVPLLPNEELFLDQIKGIIKAVENAKKIKISISEAAIKKLDKLVRFMIYMEASSLFTDTSIGKAKHGSSVGEATVKKISKMTGLNEEDSKEVGDKAFALLTDVIIGATLSKAKMRKSITLNSISISTAYNTQLLDSVIANDLLKDFYKS